ncbi:FHA domain-containing protein, partial [Enhygromyxa salina]|uniref:FHA domain-containing protein n=1 Tax=Enhygromyxa salina TaxID=215803 RepID=UPI0013FCF9CB
MTTHYVLKIQYVNKPPETRNIGARVTSIGREAGDIVLGDPQSSGRHAEIHFENGGVRVKDLGSTNGTFFGGQRSPEFAMEPGQGFSIGQTVMTLMSIQGAQRAGAGKTMIAVGGMPAGGMPPRPPGAPPGPPGFGPPPGAPPGPPGAPPGAPPQ